MKVDSLRELLRTGKVSCETCLFWVRVGDSLDGKCHYYPPRPIVLEKVERRADLKDFENGLEYDPYELLRKEEEEQWEYCMATWPKTDHSEYCSLWEPNLDCALEIANPDVS
jgi:hypothetical protein